MAKQVINIGTTANDGTGDPLRSAFDKVNDNFTELYDADAGDVGSITATSPLSASSATGDVTLSIDTSGFITGNGTTNKVPLWTSTTALGDSVIAQSGTNIGIGTTSPATIIHAADPNGAILRLERKDNNVLTGDLLGGIETYRDDDDGAYIQTFIKSYATETYGRQGYMTFGTNDNNNGNATERLRIDSAGNVGIGTTSPNNKLTVSGDGGGSAISYFNNTNAAGYGILINTPDANNARYALRVNTGAGTVFNVGNGGNVGIGTTSPTRQLTVNGTTSSFVNIKSNTTDGLSVLAFGDADDDNYAQIILDNSDNKLQIQNGSGGVISDRGITVDSSENVGIGTASPNAELEIHGNLNIGDGTSVTSIGLQRNSANYITATDAAGYLVFRTGGANERMRITPAGNVGIGTTVPIARMHIVVDDATPSIIKTLVLGGGTGVDGNGQSIQFSSSSNDSLGSQIAGTRAGSGGRSDLRFYTTSPTSVVGERMRIDSSGQIKFNNYTSASAFTGTAVANLAVDSSGNIITDASPVPDDSITYAKLGTEFTTAQTVPLLELDFSSAQVFTKTITADSTFTFTNVGIGMVKDLILTGDFVPTFPAGSKIVAGTYDGTVSNLIQIVVAGSGDYWLSISKAQ